MKCAECTKTMNILDQARAEVAKERFDKEVECQKQKLLKKKSFWDFIPFTIEIKRK